MKDAKEKAYLYDLYIVPGWRELFDRMIDDEVKIPQEGKFLDAGCGTGGYAIDLAIRISSKIEVVGIDPSEEKLELARGKAEVKKAERVSFRLGSIIATGLPDDEFDFIIGDATMLPANRVDAAFIELARVAKKGAMVILKLSTRGSFDEFFSIYWEALYDLELTEYSPKLEAKITERLNVMDAENLAAAAGLKGITSVTRKERLDYSDAKAFFESPLIEEYFLNDWLAILPDKETRGRVKGQMMKIIDRERHGMDFDVSIKATLIIGENGKRAK